MKKKWRVFLKIFQFALVMLMVTSCANQYTRFVPEEGSLYEIQFDYPDNWVLLPARSVTDLFMIYDPRSDPPTAWPRNLDEVSLEKGNIILDVFIVSDPKNEMQEYVDGLIKETQEYAQGKRKEIGFRDLVLVEDSPTEIDGYPAHTITMKYVFELDGGGEITCIRKDVYIAAEDRLYIFNLYIQEKEQNGTFAREFDKMIASIKFIR